MCQVVRNALRPRAIAVKATGLGIALILALFSTEAIGQDAQPGAQQQPRLAEIVVTAEKRSQPINQVPMAITAATGAQLADLGIADTRDLSKITPGFTFAQTQLGIPVYTLRGVGFYDQSLSSTPAVTIYQDQVPLTYPAMAEGTILDLQRVEILKGPQGTLFGQNSTGGAVNYVAAKPTDHFEAGINGGYGRFDEFDGGGFISGPLTHTLRARFAVETTQREQGWQYSYTHNATLGRANKTLYRLLLDWKPSDSLLVRLNVNGWIDKSDTQAAQQVGLLIQNPSGVPAGLLAHPFAPPNDRAADWDNALGRPQRDEHFFQTSLRIEKDVAANQKIVSISAFSDLSGHSVFDADGLPYPAYDYINGTGIKSYYQELRLQGSAQRTHWIIGANYEHDATNQYSPFEVSFASLNPTDGFAITNAGARQDTRTETYAGFANIDRQIVSRVSVQGGVRYTHSTEDAGTCGFIGNQALADLFDLLSTSLNGGSAAPNAHIGGCYTLGPAPAYLPELVQNSLTEHNVSWQGSIKWNINRDVMTYASVSKGYKNGGIPAVSATVSASLAPYQEESLLSYELGVKSTLANHRVQLNADTFYYDYSNKQILGNYLDPIFGIQPRIVNIPKSSIFGVEVSVQARPLEGLRLSVAAAYLHSRIDSYTGYDTLGQYGNFAGTPLPFAPEVTVSSDAEYDWPMGSVTAFVGGGLTYDSQTNAGVGDVALLKIDAYALLDVRTGVRKGPWTVTLYGRNVTNQYYWTTVQHIQDSIIRFAGMAPTFGIEGSYRFF